MELCLHLAEVVAVDGADEAEVLKAEDERFDRKGEVVTLHEALNIVASEGGSEFLEYHLDSGESIIHNDISFLLLISKLILSS